MKTQKVFLPQQYKYKLNSIRKHSLLTFNFHEAETHSQKKIPYP